jgi:hypothetical protein
MSHALVNDAAGPIGYTPNASKVASLNGRKRGFPICNMSTQGCAANPLGDVIARNSETPSAENFHNTHA